MSVAKRRSTPNLRGGAVGGEEALLYGAWAGVETRRGLIDSEELEVVWGRTTQAAVLGTGGTMGMRGGRTPSLPSSMVRRPLRGGSGGGATSHGNAPGTNMVSHVNLYHLHCLHYCSSHTPVLYVLTFLYHTHLSSPSYSTHRSIFSCFI